jgi:hypothetical protein
MADVQLPSLTELAQLPGMNYFAGQQAQNQIGLGNQFANQNLERGAADLQAQSLANMYNEQANPLKVQGLGLQNTGQENANTISGVEARNTAATEGEALSAKRAKLLAGASEDDLKTLHAQGEALSVRGAGEGNAEMQARGERMMKASAATIAARAKAEAEQKRTETVVGGRADVAALKAGSAERIATLTNNMKDIMSQRLNETNRAKMQAIQDNQKLTSDQRLSATIAAAAAETDPEQKQHLEELANSLLGSMVARSPFSTGIDIPATAELPKNKVPTVTLPSAPVSIPRPQLPAMQPANALNPRLVMPSAQTNRGGNSDLVGGGANDQQNVLLQEYAKATNPIDKASVERELRRVGYTGPLGGAPAAAPAGMVLVTRPDGQPGSIPAEKLKAALAAGYKQR